MGLGASAAAQVPEVATESPGRSAWEVGATAGALRVGDAFADEAEESWSGTTGARLAWRPVPMAIIGVEAWRAELAAGAGGAPLDVIGVGAHFRVRPAAERRWPLEPALDFGVARLSVDDGGDRGLAFVAGGGVHRVARRWMAGVTLRNHRLRVEEGSIVADDGPPVAIARDASLWEVRAELAIVVGGGG